MAEMPVAEQIALVRDAGYAGIELVSGMGGSLDALTSSSGERERIRALLDEAEMALPSIAGHANLLEEDPDTRMEAVRRLEAGVQMAADLAGSDGLPCLVTMAYGRPDEYEAVRETVAERLGEVARYAGQYGVTLALEPHVGQAFDRPERVLWLMERIGSQHFRLNFDNSHFEVMGYDLDSYVAPMVPHAVHTHLKDQRGNRPEDYAFLVPGEGEFDYARYLSAMQAAGYAGCVTIEISKAVQKRPDYDPHEVAARSYRTLTQAAQRSGVTLDYREPRATPAVALGR